MAGYRRRYSRSRSRERSYRSCNSVERDMYRDGGANGEAINDRYGYNNRCDDYYDRGRDRGCGSRDYDRDRRR